jgi:hypothetical protein
LQDFGVNVQTCLHIPHILIVQEHTVEGPEVSVQNLQRFTVVAESGQFDHIVVGYWCANVINVGGDHTKFVTAFYGVRIVLDDGTFAGQHVLLWTVWDGLALECHVGFTMLTLQLDGAEFVCTESKQGGARIESSLLIILTRNSPKALTLTSGDHLLVVVQPDFSVTRNRQEFITTVHFFQQQGKIQRIAAQFKHTVACMQGAGGGCETDQSDQEE